MLLQAEKPIKMQ